MTPAYVLALGILLASTASAQVDEARVVMIASTEAPTVGEPFQIQIEARHSGARSNGALEAPSFAPLRVVGTTGQMVSQSMHQVWGAAPQIESRTVVGYMLVADQPGVVTLSPATYRYGRDVVRSEPLVLKVGGEAAPSVATTTTAGEVAEFDDRVFLRAVVDRTDPYVGQQVTYTLYVYTRIDGQMNLARHTTANDFWTHDLLPPQRQMNPEIQMVRGLRFDVRVLERSALFPDRPGDLTIGGAELEMEVGGIIGRMTGQSDTIRRTCPPMTIHVRPLPDGTPAGTLVGRFGIRAEVDRTTLTTGEAATLAITVEGEGSLRDANVTLPPIDGLRIEPPVVEDHVETPHDLVGGRRILRYQLVAQRAGTFEIPALTISVLDPSSGVVSQPSTSPVRLTATGAPIDDPTVAVASDDDDDEPGPGDDALRFGPRSTDAEMRRRTLPVHARPFYLPALAAAFTFALLYYAIASGSRAVRAQRALATPKASTKKPLADASKALARGDAPAFYSGLTLAIHHALDAASGERTAGMTHTALRDTLLRRGADADLVTRLVDELEGADFARFSATGGGPDEMRRALERTRALLERIAKLRLAEAA